MFFVYIEKRLNQIQDNFKGNTGALFARSLLKDVEKDIKQLFYVEEFDVRFHICDTIEDLLQLLISHLPVCFGISRQNLIQVGLVSENLRHNLCAKTQLNALNFDHFCERVIILHRKLDWIKFAESNLSEWAIFENWFKSFVKNGNFLNILSFESDQIWVVLNHSRYYLIIFAYTKFLAVHSRVFCIIFQRIITGKHRILHTDEDVEVFEGAVVVRRNPHIATFFELDFAVDPRPKSSLVWYMTLISLRNRLVEALEAGIASFA